MAEPGTIRKTGSQLNDQIDRIYRGLNNRMYNASNYDEFYGARDRWFSASRAYGRLSKDNRLIDSFRDYRPQNEDFTSAEEIERIRRHFGLENRSEGSLRALRNNVVLSLDRIAGGNQSLRWDMMPWMQSITAVIDRELIRKGRGV